jgi:hypothetical protein
MSYLLCCGCYAIVHSGVLCGLAIRLTWWAFSMKQELLAIREHMGSTPNNDLRASDIYWAGDSNPVLFSDVFHHWYK